MSVQHISLTFYKEFVEEFKVAVGSHRDDGPTPCLVGCEAYGLKAVAGPVSQSTDVG